MPGLEVVLVLKGMKTCVAPLCGKFSESTRIPPKLTDRNAHLEAHEWALFAPQPDGRQQNLEEEPTAQSSNDTSSKSAQHARFSDANPSSFPSLPLCRFATGLFSYALLDFPTSSQMFPTSLHKLSEHIFLNLPPICLPCTLKCTKICQARIKSSW